MRAPAIPLRLTVVVGLFLALHVVLAYWRPVPLWGADMLAYYPMWVHGLFILLCALLLIPLTREGLIGWLARWPAALDPWRSHRATVISALLLAVVGGLAFVWLHSATPLLGDGLNRPGLDGDSIS